MAHTSQFAIRGMWACASPSLPLPTHSASTKKKKKLFQQVWQNLQKRASVDKWHKTLQQWNRGGADSDTSQRETHTKYCGYTLILGLFFLIFCVGPGSNMPQRNINIFGDFSGRLSQLQKSLLTTDIQRLTERLCISWRFYFLGFSFWGGAFLETYTSFHVPSTQESQQSDNT